MTFHADDRIAIDVDDRRPLGTELRKRGQVGCPRVADHLAASTNGASRQGRKPKYRRLSRRLRRVGEGIKSPSFRKRIAPAQTQEPSAIAQFQQGRVSGTVARQSD